MRVGERAQEWACGNDIISTEGLRQAKWVQPFWVIFRSRMDFIQFLLYWLTLFFLLLPFFLPLSFLSFSPSFIPTSPPISWSFLYFLFLFFKLRLFFLLAFCVFIMLIISVHLWSLIILPPSCLSFFLPSILHSILLVLVPFLLLSFVHYLPSVLHFCLLSFFFFFPHFPRDFPESPAEHFCYFVALKKGWC